MSKPIDTTEDMLIVIAQHEPDDVLANIAMKELREKYDPTYMWCEDCDGVVCKEKDCCLNQPDTGEDLDVDLEF